VAAIRPRTPLFLNDQRSRASRLPRPTISTCEGRLRVQIVEGTQRSRQAPPPHGRVSYRGVYGRCAATRQRPRDTNNRQVGKRQTDEVMRLAMTDPGRRDAEERCCSGRCGVVVEEHLGGELRSSQLLEGEPGGTPSGPSGLEAIELEMEAPRAGIEADLAAPRPTS